MPQAEAGPFCAVPFNADMLGQQILFLALIC